ncbi:hypothetical protein PAXRUDRAFT_822630 [Paxillus rubicundulus Ve08.2h10]|uniref:Uncharacterized protein n=1 Tax=Paxillus rubicundulus Ve08.2h10 TaxID=930991 RepID=A0A0D0E9M4_9AGAM|nr:hypothetical protein PAXRUDRAFT_822630 [Paxillus rubicundulus Ve08.2h10]
MVFQGWSMENSVIIQSFTILPLALDNGWQKTPGVDGEVLCLYSPYPQKPNN